jgi:hypothetical protein
LIEEIHQREQASNAMVASLDVSTALRGCLIVNPMGIQFRFKSLIIILFPQKMMMALRLSVLVPTLGSVPNQIQVGCSQK